MSRHFAGEMEHLFVLAELCRWLGVDPAMVGAVDIGTERITLSVYRTNSDGFRYADATGHPATENRYFRAPKESAT